MQIWKDSKYAFQEKQARGGGVRQSGKFPDYTGFFLLKASLSRHSGFYECQADAYSNDLFTEVLPSILGVCCRGRDRHV